MLTSFTVRDFKSFREATLPLAPLTMLVGANASGKSNLVEGLRLFSWIGRGNRLSTLRRRLRDDGSGVRGGLGNLGFDGGDSFSFACRTAHPEWNRYEIGLEKRDDGALRIANEKLTGDNAPVPLFEIVGKAEDMGNSRVAYNNFEPGGKKPQVPCMDQVTILEQFSTPAGFCRDHKKAQKTIPKATSFYRNTLKNMMFLDPEPSSMRGYSFATDTELDENGANLSAILHRLCRDDEIKAELLSFVRSLPERDISDIGFVETPRGEAMVELVETFGGRETKYDAGLLSDGTLRVLAIAAALLSAPEGGLVAIGEIDNGVHPGRARDLLERIADIAERRGIRVLATTHNPALLDALPDAAVPDVVFCFRDPEDGSSRLVRLEDIENYPSLLAQGKVGRLLARGLIDRYAKERRTAKDRQRRFSAWLEDLEARAK